MNDLISRQAAIDAVASYLYKVCLAFHSCMTHEESKECATLILQPVPSAQRWIPCSERLPKERSDWKNVTIIDESGDTSYIYTSVGFYLSDGCWIVDNEPMDDDSSIRVLAWASMPEAYREDGDT